MSAETLGSVKLVQEKRLLQKYFDEISQDTGKYCFMVSDTLRALELGAVEKIFVPFSVADDGAPPPTLNFLWTGNAGGAGAQWDA